jgi:hypothetical protein
MFWHDIKVEYLVHYSYRCFEEGGIVEVVGITEREVIVELWGIIEVGISR